MATNKPYGGDARKGAVRKRSQLKTALQGKMPKRWSFISSADAKLHLPAGRIRQVAAITIGDVVDQDGDLLGDGVNIAARLEGIAPEGGICISRSVYEATANKLAIEFAGRGHSY